MPKPETLPPNAPESTTDRVFFDILPTPEPGELGSITKVTLVFLPVSKSKQQAFMRRLHNAVAGAVEQATLQPLGELGAHAIGWATARAARTTLAIAEADDAKWEETLKSWGADKAETLQAGALLSLLDHRRKTDTAKPVKKISLPADESLSAPKPVVAPAVTFEGAITPPDAPSIIAAGKDRDWHLDERGANVIAAWDMFLNRNDFAVVPPWKNIVIGRLDTGYLEHDALAWGEGPDGPESVTIKHKSGKDFGPPPVQALPRDPWQGMNPGHGTRIDGGLAGYDPRPKHGQHPFFGAAPGVQLIPYRVTSSVAVLGDQSCIADGLNQAIADGCQVVTICFGSPHGDLRVARAVDEAYMKGIIVVCAAGQIWPWVVYPGRFNRVMTVSGHGPARAPWGTAASGKYVDWCAPSDQIRRLTVSEGTGIQTGINKKIDGDGTSYGTAVTSAIAAMWLAWHGVDNLKNRYAALWMIPAAFKKCVKQSCVSWIPGTEGANGRYGVGMIDAAKLLTVPLPQFDAQDIESEAAAAFDPKH